VGSRLVGPGGKARRRALGLGWQSTPLRSAPRCGGPRERGLVDDALRELRRVLAPGGKVVIIDENVELAGTMKIELWEK